MFEQQPDFHVFNDIIDMRRGFLGIRDWGLPRYQLYPYPQRLCLLSDSNRVYILRELGYIDKYLELETKINQMPGKQPSKQDKCIYEMTQWMDNEIKSMVPFVSEKERVVICLLSYGKEYTKKCLSYALKSLMTEGNLPTLCKEKQVLFHVQTNEAGKSLFEASPIVSRIKDLGAHFEYCIIPDSLIEQIDATSTYWLVGAGATLGIEYARACDAAFHHSYPDIIYSDKFFSELLRLEKIHSSILAPAYRGDESTILPFIKSYENDECISVPSSDLVAIGLNSIHMANWPGIMNNRPAMWSYPSTHNLIWESHEFVHFNCPHLNAFWLSKNVVAKFPKRFYISLDSELDFLCESEDYYIPQEMDNLYLIEFSNQGGQKVDDLFFDAVGYANYFWKLSTNRDNLKFFTRGMKLRINRTIRPATENTMQESNLMQEKCFLFNNIQSKDPGVGTTLTRPRTHLNRIYGVTQVSQPLVASTPSA